MKVDTMLRMLILAQGKGHATSNVPVFNAEMSICLVHVGTVALQKHILTWLHLIADDTQVVQL